MTRTEFDAWMEEVSRAVVRLVDVLDAKPGEELSDTQRSPLVGTDGLRQRASDLRNRYGRVRLPSTGPSHGGL